MGVHSSDRLGWLLLVSALVLGGACFWAGWRTGLRSEPDRARPVSASPCDDDEQADQEPSRVRRRAAQRLDTSAVDELSRRLRRAREARPTIERHWPATIDRDGPDAWPDRMQRLFEECDTALDFVATDCAEFPCVATLRGEPAEELVVELGDLFGDCPALAEDPPDAGHAMLLDYEVDCPDGATETMMIFATGDVDPLLDAYPGVPDEQVISRLLMDLGRRGTDLAMGWPCGEGL